MHIGLRLMFAAPDPGLHRAARAAGAVHLVGRRAARPDVDVVRAIGIPHQKVGESVCARAVPVHDAVGAGRTPPSSARRSMVSSRVNCLARAPGAPQLGAPAPRRALECSDALEATATSL